MRLPYPTVCSGSAISKAVIASVLLSGVSGVPAQQTSKPGPFPAPVRVSHPAAGTHSITLDPVSIDTPRGLMEDYKSPQALPANFRRFSPASVHLGSEVQTLTLRFHTGTTLRSIEGTKDFPVVQGGSCKEGSAYLPNSTCTVMVQFTPQGPGHRLGRIKVTHSADATPMYVGATGQGSAPVVSFTPSVINHIPSTYPNSVGLISGGTSLALDGGDSLYIADTGNNQVRFMDSSENLITVLNLPNPLGVAANVYGTVYITSNTTPAVYEFFPQSSDYEENNSGSPTCSVGSTCQLNSSDFTRVGAATADPYGNVFVNFYGLVDQIVTTASLGNDNFVLLEPYYDGNGYAPTVGGPIAVDANQRIYTYYRGGATCAIFYESVYYAQMGPAASTPLTGDETCGFSGDGGQARGAEIGTSIGQMAFDAAGNLYFSDTANQRVRRIDAATGLIETIAGNGTAGFVGDTGPATSATLANPTGVAVDSNGQVYILSSTTATGTAQVVRVITTVGRLSFPVTAAGTAAAVQTVQVSNTGNAALNFANVTFTSGNTSDFSIDPGTTSCVFTAPLASGRSCKIGFVFKPGAAGLRSTTLSMTDDTNTGLNTIYLAGIGATTATLTPAKLTFASTTVGSSATAQTLTLTNTGTAVLTISSIGLSGTAKASYSLTDTCGATLAAGAKCTLSIGFKPTVAGALPATLTVADNAVIAAQTVSLTGTAIAPAITTPGKPKQPPVTILR